MLAVPRCQQSFELNMLSKHGFSLLEILVALFIFSILLLGVDASLMQTARMTNGALYFYIAAEQANNVAEYLHVRGELDEQYLRRLKYQVANSLPKGQVRMNKADDNYTLTIFWGGMDGNCTANKSGLHGCLILKLQTRVEN